MSIIIITITIIIMSHTSYSTIKNEKGKNTAYKYTK